VLLDEPDLVWLQQRKPRYSSADRMIRPKVRTPCVPTHNCRNI
jgi:hypothetical protein